MKIESNNFNFLHAHDAQLVRLGALAERYCHDDPNTCLIKLRQFGELLAQLISAKTGLYQADEQSQSDLLRRLRNERVIPAEVANLFHSLRIFGNDAAHGVQGTFADAINALKYARQAAVWFHRTFGNDASFVAGPFQPPPASPDAASLRAELERFRKDLLATQSAAEQARLMAEENALARQIAEEHARKQAEERATWEELAQEAEQEKQALRERLDALQITAQAKPVDLPQIIAQGESAAQQIDLDEAATRQLIDQQITGLVPPGFLGKPERIETTREASRDFLVHNLTGVVGRPRRSLIYRAQPIIGTTALVLSIAFLGFLILHWLQPNLEQRAAKLITLQEDKGSYTVQPAADSDFNDYQLLLILPELMRLSKPIKLNLKGTRVRNISALKELKSLRGLNLEDTWVADIDALKNLMNLTDLSLGGTQVSNIDALKDLKNLRTLNLEGTRVADIDALKDLKNLKALNLEGTRVADVGALKNLKSLLDLSLANTRVANIDKLQNLKSLRTLNLGGTWVADIDALTNFESLTDLSLGGTRIANIDALKNLKKLTTLDLSETSVTDIDVLTDNKSLMSLDLSETPVANIKALKGERPSIDSDRIPSRNSETKKSRQR
jgi:hypothetical protein